MWYRIQIDGLSENASKHLKEGIEKQFPLLEGKVKIYKEPEIKPLNEYIEEELKKYKKAGG
jgi:hypothetical protein